MASKSTSETAALRFVDFGTIPKRPLAPIEGYENMPIVSLEEAVKPLVDIVRNVERNAFIVKHNCDEPKEGLTADESASIMLYTLESSPHEDSFYVILNTTLRSEQRQGLKPWFLYLRLILTALARLPSDRRTVNRGVREDLRERYPIGKSFVWWGFSSCTSSVGVLEGESFFGKTGTRTLFQIECYSGKNIREHSFIQHEDEILLPPARQFIVTSCLTAGNGLQIIQIKETEPKYPLIKPVSLPEQNSSRHSSKPVPSIPSTIAKTSSGLCELWLEIVSIKIPWVQFASKFEHRKNPHVLPCRTLQQ